MKMVLRNKRHQEKEERFDVDHPLSYFGKGESECFAKMVHTGVTYGDMQMIGETIFSSLLLNSQTSSCRMSSSGGIRASSLVFWL